MTMTTCSCRRFVALSILVLFTVGLTGYVAAQTTDVYTTPVGFYQLPAGTGAAGSFTLVGLPMQQMKNDQGLITGVSSNTLSVNCSTCATNNFGDPNNQNYLELVTGQATGRYFAVITNDVSGNITLAVGSENLTALGSGGAVQTGDRYIIRPFWRLKDVFGPATNCVLQSGTKVGNSDNVFVWNGSTWLVFFPNSTGGVWVQSGFGVNDNFPLLPDEGMFLLRRSATSTNAVLVGEVRITNTVSVLQSGYNLVCNSYPAGTTLENSGLTNALTGFHAGTKVGNSDNVLMWDPVGQTWQVFYYNTTGNTWVQSGVGATNGVPLNANNGYFVFSRTTSGYWNKVLPYSP